MKFLIAGLGSIGRRHLRNLRALGEQDILLYRTHRATLPDEELAGVPVETDLRRALDPAASSHRPGVPRGRSAVLPGGRARPDAVIVANPTALHLDVAIPAAEAGCHLLLEKPVSHSLERLDELQAAVQRGGGQVQVGFHFRFHPGLRRLKGLLDEGAIGRPVSARAAWGEYLPGWHPWEDYRLAYAARPDLGGGVILTLCHPLDYLHWLLGEVEELWALTGRHGLGLEVEDSAEIGLRFASGALGSVHLDYLRRPGQHTLEIVGTQGTLAWDNADGALRLSRAGPDDKAGGWQTFPAPEGFERNTLFLDEMRNFIAVIQGKAEPACTLAEGIYALKLALAALRAGREKTVQPIGSR
jgi:predicted dehydrogenase